MTDEIIKAERATVSLFDVLTADDYKMPNGRYLIYLTYQI
jgi:hypothetical protein